MKLWFLRLAAFASFAITGALSAWCADTANPLAIDFQPDPQQDLVGSVILAGLGCSIGVLVIWQLWLYFSPGSGGRSARSQTADGYIRSNCRFCGGSIEFPEHGLGEWVDCPHCNRQTQLRRMGATERFLVGLRVWCRQGSFNWKWASALMAVVLICGTALFIYADIKAQSAERTKREAESEKARDDQRNYYLSEQAAAMQRANEIAQEAQEKAQEEARRKELDANSQSFGSLLRPSLAQQQLNEMKRANDMAEMERIQPSDWYEKFRQEQALKGQQRALEDMNGELRRIREAKEREEFDRRFRVR